MELTPEQKLEKLKLETTLYNDYHNIISRFLQKQVFNLPEETMVYTTAFGVNREEILYRCLENILEKRRKALEYVTDPNQMTLF